MKPQADDHIIVSGGSPVATAGFQFIHWCRKGTNQYGTTRANLDPMATGKCKWCGKPLPTVRS